MFKKLLVVACAALFLTVGAGSAMAFGDCGGEPCTDVQVPSVFPNVEIHGAILAPGSDGMNGGKAVGDFIVSGDAFASGRDTIEWVKVQDTEPSGSLWRKVHGRHAGRTYSKPFNWHPEKKSDWVYVGPKYGYHWEERIVAGEAEADGNLTATMTSSVDIFTNGKQFNSGLSYSYVKSTSELNIDGKVWAEGTQGCLQTAEISVDGSVGAFAYGGSYVEGPNSSYASANGYGLTTVHFSGFESDQSTHGFLWFPNRAEVDFSSTVNVEQSILNLSYVSPDGTTAANFAYVGGGSAELDRGRDGWFGQDNINLTGIQAEGSVAQNAMATNGYGSGAWGGSSAYFSGAQGTVNSTRGWCGPDQTATVGGMAVVGGYNNITTSPGSLTVTSHQYGYATTGNSGPVQPD